MAIAIGLIIGAGIITLTGTAIGLTGRAICLAFIIAAIVIALTNIPFAVVGGTVRLAGGQYTHLAMFSGKFLTGVSLYTTAFAVIALGMYGISFGQYLMELVPGLPLIAIAVITVIFIFNFFGCAAAVADTI